jgi:hypothetical protein
MPDGSLHPLTYVGGFFIGILTIVVPLLCVLLL